MLSYPIFSRFIVAIATTVHCFCLMWPAVADGATSGVPGDLEAQSRDVSHQDLILDSSTKFFKRIGVEDYGHVAVDEPLQQIIVGSRDYLLRLNLTSMRLLEVVRWSADNATVALCLAKGQQQENCRNVVRVVLIHGDAIFVCGTNAYSPRCSWRKRSSLSSVIKLVPGVAKCPYDPRQNNTYLMTADGTMYAGTVTDFTGRDAAFYRSMGSLRPLRTVQYNSRWLNDPNFVSSYEIDDFVYFFFRETAVEFINCGKAVYSRVARVCKNDPGGRVLFEDNWTTFVKSRLNCSIPGEFPFYYNELQATHVIESEKLVYAVFTTPPNAIHGSAVCVFNYSAFNFAFGGSFKFQENAQSAWTRVSNHGPVSCGRHQPDKSSALALGSALVHTRGAVNQTYRHLVDVQKFQMMDSAVQPVHHRPPIVVDLHRFTHIAVDRVNVTRNGRIRKVHVVFLASLEGAIHKYVVMTTGDGSGTAESCLVERINLSPDVGRTTPGYIRTLRINTARAMWNELRNHPEWNPAVHEIVPSPTTGPCLEFQDPYCGWDSRSHSCVAIGHPNLSRCSKRSRNKLFTMTGAEKHTAVASQWTPWTQATQFHTNDVHRETRTRCSCRPLPVLDVDSRHCRRKLNGETVDCLSTMDSTSPRHDMLSSSSIPTASTTTERPLCPEGCCRNKVVESIEKSDTRKLSHREIIRPLRLNNTFAGELLTKNASHKYSDEMPRQGEVDHVKQFRAVHRLRHKDNHVERWDPFVGEGFCKCRDLGQLRVCLRCNTPDNATFAEWMRLNKLSSELKRHP